MLFATCGAVLFRNRRLVRHGGVAQVLCAPPHSAVATVPSLPW